MSAITPMQRSLLIEAHRNDRLVVRPVIHNRRQCAEALSRRQLLKPVGWLLADGRQVKGHAPNAVALVYRLTAKGKLALVSEYAKEVSA